MRDNESICSECDKKINDDIETKWNLYSDPYCIDCYTDEMKNEVSEYYKKEEE